jgi:hypothetical protein
MDSWVRIPDGTNADDMLDLLLHTLERLHPYGVHSMNKAGSEVMYQGFDMESNELDSTLTAALGHLMKYAAVLTGYKEIPA